jgi:type I restriction enzyme, S subunit
MIADLKPYLEYKESGLPWLGQVPGHWEVKRLKDWVTVNASTLSEDTPYDYEFEYLDIGSVGTGRLTKNLDRLRFASAPSRARRLLRPGDTIVSTVRTYLKAVFTVGRISEPLIASTGFAVLTPRADTIPRCLGYIAQSEYFTNQVTGESVGIAYPAISETKLANIPITLPPPTEQAAIVRFLDWTNGRLERAIRAKRQVIALLTEQKQTIIASLVTGKCEMRRVKSEDGHEILSLTPRPSHLMKPSGLPWLGDIPQHWEVERTKNVFRLRTQKSGRGHGKELLSIYTHIGVRPRKDLEQKGNKASTTDDYWIVQKGDLIINKLLAWMGAVGVSDYEGVTSPAYDILMPIRRLCSDYYHHLFRTKLYLQQFKQRSRGIMDMRLRLYFDQFGQIPVLFPPVDEQSEIVAFCIETTADLTTAISRLSREIELLREYRTCLVADVVTGKLDVREAAARLPDEAPPDIAEDDTHLSDDDAELTDAED